MTLNLRIMNLCAFSRILNACSADGAVHRFPDDTAAASLCSRKPKNGTRLPVAVRIHAPRDYFNIVSYYAGDC